jgi:hypothetical protein
MEPARPRKLLCQHRANTKDGYITGQRMTERQLAFQFPCANIWPRGRSLDQFNTELSSIAHRKVEQYAACTSVHWSPLKVIIQATPLITGYYKPEQRKLKQIYASLWTRSALARDQIIFYGRTIRFSTESIEHHSLSAFNYFISSLGWGR